MASGEKTEKATPKRRQEERRKGNIFQSRDFTSALGFLGVFSLLYAAGPYALGWFEEQLKQYLSGFSAFSDLSDAAALRFVSGFAVKSLLLSLPFLAAAAVLGFILDAAQTRLNFSVKRIKVDFKKINPATGLKRVFNLRSIVELIKNALKVAIVAVIVYGEIKSRLPGLVLLTEREISNSISYICQSLFAIVMKAGIAMTAFGVLDYFYQWWNYERQIRMSKQEIKDEYKQSEGDPQVRGRVREQQRRLSRMRVMQAVPQADVLIRNPTHYAVAVKYEQDKNHAPVVIAKGKDYLALKMVETAEKAGVRITENPPLARGLYAAVKTGREIPEEFYQAVAEVLAFVYGLQGGKR